MRIFLDCETHLITPGVVAPRLISMMYALDGGDVVVLTRDDALRTWVDAICPAMDAGAVFVGCRSPFDLLVMANETGTLGRVFGWLERGLIRDVQVRQKLIYIEAGAPKHKIAQVSLAALAKEHLGVHVGDTKRPPKGVLDQVLAGDFTRLLDLPPRFRYAQLEGLALDQWPEEFVKYAIDDVLLTRDVYFAQGPDELVNEVESCKADFALSLMAAWGVVVDQNKVDEFERVNLEKIALHEQVLLDAGVIECYTPKRGKNKGIEKRTKKKKILQEIVSNVLGESAPLTESGGIQTDKDALKKSLAVSRKHAAVATCSDMTDAWAYVVTTLEAAVGISSPQTMINTYVKKFRQGKLGPLNTRFDVLKRTGRVSSRGPALQNVPRKGLSRGCVVARSGMRLVGADYTAIEMVSLAFICKKMGFGDTMATALNAGLDPHIWFGAQLKSVRYKALKAQYDAEQRAVAEWEAANTAPYPHPTPATDIRQFAKVANYGYPGGMGWESFIDYAEGFGVQLNEQSSQALKLGFLETWPEMPKYFRYIAKLVGRDSGTIEQLFSGRKRGKVGYCAACNTLFQGLTADGAKNALWIITLACRDETSPLFGFKPVIFVHDEIILEGPHERADAALAELIRLMIQGMQPYMPGMLIKADGKITECWTK